MRKFKVTIDRNETMEIISDNKDNAKKESKAVLGIDINKNCWVRMKEYYLNLDNLKKRCDLYLKEKGRNPEIESWKPCYLNDKERRRESHIEIPRLDGYFDSIYFELGEESKMDEIVKELQEIYPYKITPLEKFHASF